MAALIRDPWNSCPAANALIVIVDIVGPHLLLRICVLSRNVHYACRTSTISARIGASLLGFQSPQGVVVYTSGCSLSPMRRATANDAPRPGLPRASQTQGLGVMTGSRRRSMQCTSENGLSIDRSRGMMPLTAVRRRSRAARPLSAIGRRECPAGFASGSAGSLGWPHRRG